MDPLVVDAGEATVEEILDALEGGRRVVVRTEVVGDSREITLRYDGGVFYCDTPTRLHRHERRDAMRECIEKQGYASA